MKEACKENNYYYNKGLKTLADCNRGGMTKSVACIWKYVLGNRQMRGYQFRRERPVLNYIADFVCLELLLIIEVDGITHDEEKSVKRDQFRDGELQEIGFSLLRFGSWEVLNRIHDVSILIAGWIDNNSIATPDTSRERKSDQENL